MKNTTRWLVASFVASLVAVLTACGGGLLGNQGRIRLINATTGLGALDLQIDGSTAISGVAPATGSDYVLKKADTYTLDILQSGNAASLLTTQTALVADKHQTVVAYNSGGTIAATILNDEEGDPAHGKAKLRIFNTATATADQVDVYLITADCSTLATSPAAPIATSVSGLQTAYNTLSSSTTPYNVCITTTADKTDLRLAIPSFVLSDQRIVTVILALGPGGYLMNALVVDQQATVAQALNPSGRARVATSVQGNPISVSVNATTIAAALPSPNVGPYVLVPYGTVTLLVNGQPVTPTTPQNGTPTVAPGGDVTVLLTGTGTTATLLADDNTPSSSTAKPVKLRLVNGLNGTTGQASLTLNNGFVASGVAPGAASPYTLVVSSAGLVTLQATIGAGTFYLNPTATLNAGGVYTLFLLGDGSSPPTIPNVGILFTDR